MRAQPSRARSGRHHPVDGLGDYIGVGRCLEYMLATGSPRTALERRRKQGITAMRSWFLSRRYAARWRVLPVAAPVTAPPRAGGSPATGPPVPAKSVPACRWPNLLPELRLASDRGVRRPRIEEMDERQFSPTSRPSSRGAVDCPYCRTAETVRLHWVIPQEEGPHPRPGARRAGPRAASKARATWSS